MMSAWRLEYPALKRAVREPMVCGLSAGGRWIRTIGPWRHAVGSVMENVDNLAEPAGRLSQSTTLRACYVPALVKGSMAWLLCLPVGQALPLASSYRSTLFFFRRETNGSNPFPSSGESANFWFLGDRLACGAPN